MKTRIPKIIHKTDVENVFSKICKSEDFENVIAFCC